MPAALSLTYGSPLGNSPRDVEPEIGVLGANASARVRLIVAGMDQVSIRLKGQTTGTVTLDLIPMGGDAGKDWSEKLGTPMTTGAPSQVAVADDTEAIIEYVLKGEYYVDVLIATGAASSFDASAAADFIFAFARP